VKHKLKDLLALKFVSIVQNPSLSQRYIDRTR